MAVRDEEQNITRALDSLTRQTYPNLELLVVDGMSTDSTRAVVERIASLDQRVRLLTNPRKIIPSALNVGLAAARGQYVMRVDGHWTVSPDYVEMALTTLADHDDAAAVGGRRNGSGTTWRGKAIAAALSSRFGVGDSVYHYGTELQETDHATGGLYRAEILRDVGGWDEELRAAEDVELDFRIRRRGHQIIFQPGMVSSWRVREDLRAFAHQYRRYGRGKAANVRKHGGAVLSLRHLAPPALVAAVPASLLLAATRHPRLALLPWVPYAGLMAAASRELVRDTEGLDSPRHQVYVAGAFAAMHLGWGLGFWEGLVLGAMAPDSSGQLTSDPKSQRSAPSI